MVAVQVYVGGSEPDPEPASLFWGCAWRPRFCPKGLIISLQMGHDSVVRAPCLILPLQLLGVTRGISPSLCQRPARAVGSRVGSFWARKRRREPGNDLWEQGDNIPEEQNWEKRTGMDNDPKEQAEQDSPVLAKSLIWPQIIFFSLKNPNKQNQKNPKPPQT